MCGGGLRGFKRRRYVEGIIFWRRGRGNVASCWEGSEILGGGRERERERVGKGMGVRGED